tara:strand:+ start:302 stop:796 length:495 start_codon:yes stop_codon:yes gene_type:complete
MAGYIGSKASVTQVDGYTRTGANAEFVQVNGDTMTGDLNITGTLEADNVTDGTTSVATGYVVNGSAKVFASIYSNSTLNTTSLNASSFTDNGAGSGWVDFVSALTEASYKVGVASQINGAGAGATMRGTSGGSTTSRYDIRTYNGANSAFDTAYMSITIHGDLA